MNEPNTPFWVYNYDEFFISMFSCQSESIGQKQDGGHTTIQKAASL